MGYVSCGDRSHLRGFQRNDCGGAAVECEKLDFVGLAVFVDVHNCANVAFFKTFRRNRFG